MKRNSRIMRRPRNAFVFIREDGSYWHHNAESGGLLKAGEGLAFIQETAF
jgi:hypothetical protein